MRKKNKSILRKLFIYMMGFGIAMGLIFPVYANIFVEFKPGLFPYFLGGCICAGITVGVVSFWFVKTILIKQLLKVSQIAVSISQKDISTKLNIESDDAVGIIADGFNTAVLTLNEFVNNIRQITGTTQSIAGQNNGSTKGTIEEITNTLSEVTEAIYQTSDQSKSIQDKVLQSRLSLNKVTKNLEHTNSSMSTFGETVNKLTDHIEEIGHIILFIKDIALQTNLLALNAGIEASKAGEYGRSFSVVAKEIQKLSENIGKSVNKVEYIFTALNNELEQTKEINTVIISQFEENLKQNKEIQNVVNSIDNASQLSLTEGHHLINSVQLLNQSVENVNKTFNTFSSYMRELDETMQLYTTTN